MQLATIVTALLLPLTAVANPPGVPGVPGVPGAASDDFSTTTLTSYVTLTQTVTLERSAIQTVTAKNSTATFTTGSPSSKVTTTAASPLPTGGATALGSSNIALAAIAGVVVAAFL